MTTITQRLAEDEVFRILDRHGLHRWWFRWSHSRTEAGRCTATARDDGVVEVSLPWARANAFAGDFVNGVALHEIAHALVGPQRGHDDVWAAKCRQLGGIADYAGVLARFYPPGRYRTVCGCGARQATDRVPPAVYRCPVCRGLFSYSTEETWKPRPRPSSSAAVGPSSSGPCAPTT